MYWASYLGATAAIASQAVSAQSTSSYGAMMRFGCAFHSTERLDPVVQPGVSPSQHLHNIVGGNSFNETMQGNVGAESSCTSCSFAEDFSNYWGPALFFRARNGSFAQVPIIPNEGIMGANSGITVYYTSPTDATVNITAPPAGFRMVVGSPTVRTRDYENGSNAYYRCYTNGAFDPNPYGLSNNDTYKFPTQYCKGGMRVNAMFPNCWDGVNLDSANHKTHVASGYSGCPASHPVQLPQIMLETVYDTGSFPASEWPVDTTQQPFVWAQGDPTGYGYHADYVFGWKGEALQNAVNQRCGLDTCAALTTQNFKVANTCTKNQTFVENVTGWLPTLPGNMTVM